MTRISGGHPLAGALAERIAKLRRERRGGSEPTARAVRAESGAVDRLRTLTGNQPHDDRRLRHAVVRGVLIDQLGEVVGNDPSFEDIALSVSAIIEATPEGVAMIDAAMRKLTDSD